ncbi:MAG: secretin N-terminal domain-containing protein, partial [Candidatus Methylomirabilia bacterium]
PSPVAPPLPPRAREPLPELPVSQIEEKVTKVVPRKLYTLSVRNADIQEVLLAFGKKTELNIVFGPDVQGVVTVDLKRVTLEEALDALLSPLALVYKREGNFIRVSEPAVETRIFTVNYISTTRTGAASLSATSGGATAGTTGATTGGTTAGGGTTGATSSVTSADSVDLWGELEKTLAGFLSEDGKAVISRTAGLIAVTDFPRNLRRVAQYLELVEGSAQRQVMIQAQVIEVALSKDFSAGIDWSLVARQSLRLGPLGVVTGALTGGSLIAQTLAPAAADLFQVGVSSQLGSQTVQVLLKALSAQGKVAILSSPKISTLNNQKAVMKVAVDDVFFTVTRERDPTTGVVTETVTPQTVTEGIVLDVTPQIGEDDTIIMNIRPSISERVGQATSPSGDVVPIVAVRAADTVVRVKDGQTVVIGGLMQNRSSRNVTGVPLLQDVPVLGGLFRQRQDDDRKTELVILLTPTLLIGRRHSELTPREVEILREVRRAKPLR